MLGSISRNSFHLCFLEEADQQVSLRSVLVTSLLGQPSKSSVTRLGDFFAIFVAVSEFFFKKVAQ